MIDDNYSEKGVTSLQRNVHVPFVKLKKFAEVPSLIAYGGGSHRHDGTITHINQVGTVS